MLSIDKSNFLLTKMNKSAKQSLCSLTLKVCEVSHVVIKQLAFAFSSFQQGNSAKAGKLSKENFLLIFIEGLLLIFSMVFALEASAYWHGWYSNNSGLQNPESIENDGWMNLAYFSWISFRDYYISSSLRFLKNICIVLSIIQSVDRMILCIGCIWIKLRKIKLRVKFDSLTDSNEFPMVLVQIPICNEKEVFEQCFYAACHLDWPKDRILIQVLDDSDDKKIQQLIQAEAAKWSQRGASIIYKHRSFRTGFKAGNLKSGMSCEYAKNYEFVAIFDADFQPSPDFLKQTVPHFNKNPKLGLVQARWSFANKDENLLTQFQHITLCFHFEVEQQVNGVFLNFFGFNGTAGVWRMKALEDCGGWIDRTTVEDMDIAVRAHLKGWDFLLLNDVRVFCEAPESYETYQNQQYRWHSGPINLFRLCLPSVLTSKISVWRKANLILLFFLLRKLILPFFSFTVTCIIFPVTMFVPGTELPVWLICYIPIIFSLFNMFMAPGSFPFILIHFLFENTISMTKFSAMLSGLLQLGSSHEWIVTKKEGRPLKPNLLAAMKKDSEENNSSPNFQQRAADNKHAEEIKLKDKEVTHVSVRKANKIYKEEIALALFLLMAAGRSLLSAKLIHFYLLLFQGVMFLLVGLGLFGEQMT